MKISETVRRFAALFLLVTVMAALACPVFADVSYPTPTDYIADDAPCLSEQTVKQIKETNQNLINEVKAVIAVCTVKTTSGIEIGKYARSLYSEWKLPAGILIVVATDDNAFFLVPSTSVSAVIGNSALEEIRDQYIEDDFAAGKIDTAVRKAVTQLSVLMLRELKTEAETPDDTQSQTAPAGTAPAEEKSGGIVSLIVRVIKAVLIIILIALILFVLLFVAALFNDNVAALMQKYIFRRGGSKGQNNSQYYDDRLYGQTGRQGAARTNSNRRPVQYDENGYPIRQQNPRPRQNGGQYPQQSPRNRQYPQNRQYSQNGQYARNGQVDQNGQYPQNGQYARNQGQTYYNADGTVRQQNPNRSGSSAHPGRGASDSYGQNPADGATRAYTIPGRNRNNR